MVFWLTCEPGSACSLRNSLQAPPCPLTAAGSSRVDRRMSGLDLDVDTAMSTTSHCMLLQPVSPQLEMKTANLGESICQPLATVYTVRPHIKSTSSEVKGCTTPCTPGVVIGEGLYSPSFFNGRNHMHVQCNGNCTLLWRVWQSLGHS